MQTCLAGLLSTRLLHFCDCVLCPYPTSWGDLVSTFQPCTDGIILLPHPAPLHTELSRMWPIKRAGREGVSLFSSASLSASSEGLCLSPSLCCCSSCHDLCGWKGLVDIWASWVASCVLSPAQSA